MLARTRYGTCTARRQLLEEEVRPESRVSSYQTIPRSHLYREHPGSQPAARGRAGGRTRRRAWSGRDLDLDLVPHGDRGALGERRDTNPPGAAARRKYRAKKSPRSSAGSSVEVPVATRRPAPSRPSRRRRRSRRVELAGDDDLVVLARVAIRLEDGRRPLAADRDRRPRVPRARPPPAVTRSANRSPRRSPGWITG
jgi:hypothetical protein